jgi:DNA primase large subunit
MNQSGCNPAPWNGQLMETWNTPGYYGGWTNGPVACDPFTLQCRGWVQP